MVGFIELVFIIGLLAIALVVLFVGTFLATVFFGALFGNDSDSAAQVIMWTAAVVGTVTMLAIHSVIFGVGFAIVFGVVLSICRAIVRLFVKEPKPDRLPHIEPRQ